MILVIFVVQRAESGLLDMFIVNKFFRPDGTTNRTFMSKTDIVPAEVEKVVTTTSGSFSLALKSKGGKEIQWDELDLRNVSGREQQVQSIKAWGKLTTIRIKS